MCLESHALYNIYSSLPTSAPNVLHWIWVPLSLTSNQTIPNVLALNLNLSIALDGAIKMGSKHENSLIQSIRVPILASSLTGVLSLLVFASRLCFQTSTFPEKKRQNLWTRTGARFSTGLKANSEIKTSWIVAKFLAHKPVNFPSLTDNFIVLLKLLKIYWNVDLLSRLRYTGNRWRIHVGFNNSSNQCVWI